MEVHSCQKTNLKAVIILKKHINVRTYKGGTLMNTFLILSFSYITLFPEVCNNFM